MWRGIGLWMEEQGGGVREGRGSRLGVAESLYYTSTILYSATEIDMI